MKISVLIHPPYDHNLSERNTDYFVVIVHYLSLFSELSANCKQ